MSDAKETTAGAPDLDAWRAEAGDCAPLDAAATRDWAQAHHIDEPRAIVSLDDMTVSLLALDRDGMAIFDRVEDARFAVAARTGWPRDAARVAVLADEVERLRASLAQVNRRAQAAEGLIRRTGIADDIDTIEPRHLMKVFTQRATAMASYALEKAEERVTTLEARIATLEAAAAPTRDADPCHGSRGW